MDFEVDTDELRNMEKRFTDSSSSFNEEIKYLRNQLEKLKEIWFGIDADSFYAKFDEYLIKLEMLTEVENMFGTAFKKSYTIYEDNDNELTNILRKENSQYEDEEFLATGGMSKKQNIYADEVKV